MSLRIPDHILSLRSYNPGKAVHQLQEEFGFKRAAVLWNNENLRGPSPRAMEALQRMPDLNYYPDALCTQFSKAVSGMSGVPAENIVPGNGSEGVLNYVLKALVPAGEHLLTSEGTFAPVYIWCQSHNIPVVKVPLTDDYRFDAEALVDKVNKQTRIIYISNPNNPTGTWIGEEEIRYVLDRIPEDVYLLLDEAYIEYARVMVDGFPDGTRIKDQRLILLRTFSKAFGLAGARIGYGICDKVVAEQLNKMRLTFEPSLPAQILGAAAAGDLEYAQESARINKQELTSIGMHFNDAGYRVIPGAGNFLMIETASPEECDLLTLNLLRQGVLVRKLNGFGLPRCLRINSGQEEDSRQLRQTLELQHV